MLKIQRYFKTQKHIVMLQVEDEFAQKSDQIEASLKILLSQYFSGSSLGSGEKWCCPFWTMRGVALREPSGPRARADLQNIPFIFFLKIWTWGCVVVPCFCSEDIVRKLPSPEIIFQTPNHQKHDNESNVTCLGNPSKTTSSGFFPLRGYPSPRTPLAENHFVKKNLSQTGGYPPPPP